jgi:leucyl/phenylalanyl-tRNA--protein transferase
MADIVGGGRWRIPRISRVIEPPVSPWHFPDPRGIDDDLIAIGADLAPGTLLAAYRAGLFPMPLDDDPTGWFSPVRRGVLPLAGLKVSKSLRRSFRDYEIRVDTAFSDVIEACADPARDGGWIDGEIQHAYGVLHELGWAHSVEAWHDGELAGGLYGIAIGGLFAGESMFHRRRDASKALRWPCRAAAARRSVAHRSPGVAGRGGDPAARVSRPPAPGPHSAAAGRPQVRTAGSAG